MTFYPLLHKFHPAQVPQNSSLMTHYQHNKSLDHLLLTTGYLTVVPHATINPFSATFEMLKPVTYPFHLQMEPQRSQLSREPQIVTSPLTKDKDLSFD